MSAATLTKPGTPKLSDVARRCHAPAGIVTTGWPAVEAKSRDLGIAYRWWQTAIGRMVLGKRADGAYASTIGGTGLSIPRQVGKTFLVAGLMFALCLLRPGFTVLWTAHRLKTAEETFGKLQVFARRRKIAPHILKVTTGSGDEVIYFRNGSRILFGARERGFGRGFDEVDALVFDEAQILTDAALDDMVPATNQSRQPEGALMLFMGTPPRPQDRGEVFTRMRTDAEAGDQDTGWVEFGADPEFLPTSLPADLSDADWGQITRANPSFPTDTSKTAILRMRKKLGDDSFLREGLGIWTERLSDVERLAGMWAQLSAGVQPMVRPTLAVEVALDRSRATIGAAWIVDGKPHVEVVEDRPGADWVIDRCAELVKRYNGGAVVLDAGTEAAALEAAFTAAYVKTEKVNTAARSAACGRFYDIATTAGITHNGDPAISAALANARWKPSGDARVFSRRRSAGDIAALYAVVLALHGLMTKPAGPVGFVSMRERLEARK